MMKPPHAAHCGAVFFFGVLFIFCSTRFFFLVFRTDERGDGIAVHQTDGIRFRWPRAKSRVKAWKKPLTLDLEGISRGGGGGGGGAASRRAIRTRELRRRRRRRRSIGVATPVTPTDQYRAPPFSRPRAVVLFGFVAFFFVPARTIIEFCRRSTFSFCPSIDTSWRRSSAISDRLFTGFFHRKQKRPTGPRHGLTTLYRTSKLSLLPPSYVCGVGGSGGSDVVGSIRGAASPTASLFCRVSRSSTTPRWPPRDRRTRRASPHVAGVCRVRIGVGLIGQRGRVGEKRNARATTLPWAALGWVGGGGGGSRCHGDDGGRSINTKLAGRTRRRPSWIGPHGSTGVLRRRVAPPPARRVRLSTKKKQQKKQK